MNPDDAAYEEPAVDEPAVDDPLPEAPLKAILEALLFASDEPVALEEISGILGEQRAEEISSALYEVPFSVTNAQAELPMCRLTDCTTLSGSSTAD